MLRSDYYVAMKALAAEKRATYSVTTATLGLSKLRTIYKQEGIKIDLWRLSPRLRAVYMCADNEPSVLVNRNLPKEPRLFSMVHELKHHYRDRTQLSCGRIKCGDYNANQMIEIGAEIFAAEFIYPEQEFLDCVSRLGITPGHCSAEQVVEIKRVCGALVSYKFLQKRLEWFQFIQAGQFATVQFQKLEESLYGLPIYKQPWFKQMRSTKRKTLQLEDE